MKFKEYRLDELLKIKYGKNQKNVIDEKGKYPILGTGGLMGFANKFLYNKPSVLIGRKGTINKVKYIDIPFWTVDTLFYTEINENIIIPRFLYYKLSTINFDFYNEGTTIPSLRTETLSQIQISIPEYSIQNKIVKILSDIDKKIEVNNQINNNLQNMSQELYKRWFVDFEFPNEEGKPYKSSGGEMRESELGDIPEGWEIKKLSDFFPVITGKKDANASSLNGKYPFFTCSKSVSGINEYTFDDSAILLAGNGDFNVKFYRGKFDAYQRTYVLIPYDDKLLGFLYQTINLKLEDITSGYRGSVIKFITKGQIENFKIPFRDNLSIFKDLQVILSNSESIKNQNKVLEELRDTLLPKLLNGEIDLEQIEV